VRVLPDVQRPPVALTAQLEQLVPGLWHAMNDNLTAAAGDETDLLVITSWWRSPLRNVEVGGVAHSQHLLGTAFDVDGPLASIARMRARALRLNWQVLGPYQDSHLHLQVWRDSAELRRLFRRLGLG
jgi:uncharacterized protein YcbK (DUF882 family)